MNPTSTITVKADSPLNAIHHVDVPKLGDVYIVSILDAIPVPELIDTWEVIVTLRKKTDY